MNKIFLLLVILGSSTLSFAQKGGFVYQDVNENGIFDKKEPHIPNVLVSDGFTQTNVESKGTPVQPSGLLGPVGLFIAKDQD